MSNMTKQELIEAAYEITGGNVADLSIEKIQRLMTITQFVTDTCLKEVEERGELRWHEGFPVVDYHCDHHVETILNRQH